MGGRPKAHTSGGEFELGYYRLNLDKDQLNEVAKILALPDDLRQRIATIGGVLQPSDGQEVMVTYRGRYVRITYKEGKAVNITPKE